MSDVSARGYSTVYGVPSFAKTFTVDAGKIGIAAIRSVTVVNRTQSTTALVYLSGSPSGDPYMKIGPGGRDTMPCRDTGLVTIAFTQAGDPELSDSDIVFHVDDHPQSSGGLAQNGFVGIVGNGNTLRVGADGSITAHISPPTSTIAAQTQVAQNAASVTLLNPNPDTRKLFTIQNALASTDSLFVSLGATPATVAAVFSVILAPGESFTPPMNYVGAVYGIWGSAGAGYAQVTEYS